MSVGLINPFQKLREVFICSVEFLKFCSKLLLWFPLSEPCQDALLSSPLIKAFFFTGLPVGSAIAAAKWASGVWNPPYEEGCDPSN